MAMSLQEQLRAKRAETERWIRQREAELKRVATMAEAKGRQVFADAIKTTEKVLARTPAEVRALGAAALQGRLPKTVVRTAAAPSSGASTRSATKAIISEPRPISKAIQRELEAGVSGFVDEATMGLADHVLAGGNALVQVARDGDASGLRRAYEASMATKRQEDEFDAKHHAMARNSGRVVGFVGSVAALGAPAVTRAAVMRLPRSGALLRDIAVGAKRGPDPRGLTKLGAAGGGLAGLVDQTASDLIIGKASDGRDSVGAVVGGAAGGIATRFLGPTAGAAVGGATTSAVKDLLHGKAPTLDDAIADARSAAVLGRIGDLGGRHWISTLNSRAKGEVGELLSRAKTVMRGDRTVGTQVSVPVGPRTHTIADEVGFNPRTNRQYIGESKMGPSARLTTRQREAQALFGEDYILDQWRFSDVGAMAGGAMAPLGASILDEDRMAARFPPTTVNRQR